MTRATPLGLAAALLGTALSAGCKGEITPDAAVEYDVTGRVAGPDGRPLRDVRIAFRPTGGAAAPNSFAVKDDGTFSGKIRGGSYTYLIAPEEAGGKETAKSKAVLDKLPESFKSATLDRQITVGSDGPLELKF
jgi:hypothetical protein